MDIFCQFERLWPFADRIPQHRTLTTNIDIKWNLCNLELFAYHMHVGFFRDETFSKYAKRTVQMSLAILKLIEKQLRISNIVIDLVSLDDNKRFFSQNCFP